MSFKGAKITAKTIGRLQCEPLSRILEANLLNFQHERRLLHNKKQKGTVVILLVQKHLNLLKIMGGEMNKKPINKMSY